MKVKLAMIGMVYIFIALVLMVLFCLYAKEACAGSNFSTLSEVTSIIKLKNDKEMQEIAEEIREAKELSQKGLSKEKLDEYLAKANEVLKGSSSSAVYYEWLLYELSKNIAEPNLFHLDMALFSEQVARDGKDTEFFSRKERNNVRIAVKEKKFDYALQMIKEAQEKLKSSSAVAAAVVFTSSTTITRWHP